MRMAAAELVLREGEKEQYNVLHQWRRSPIHRGNTRMTRRQRTGAIYCITTPQASTWWWQTSQRKDFGLAVSLACTHASAYNKKKIKKRCLCTLAFFFVLQSCLFTPDFFLFFVGVTHRIKRWKLNMHTSLRRQRRPRWHFIGSPEFQQLCCL